MTELLSLLHKPFEIIFDKTESIPKRLSMFIIVISFIIFLNNIFWFSYYYDISKKVDNINKIEIIKNNFSWNTILIKNLDSIESDILERKTIITYFTNMEFWKSNKEIWYYITLNWFWILAIIWLFTQFSKNIPWTIIAFIAILIVIWIWLVIFNFIYWFIWFENYSRRIIANIIFSIILIYFSVKYSNKKKK
jgi:hypothetical protein